MEKNLPDHVKYANSIAGRELGNGNDGLTPTSAGAYPSSVDAINANMSTILDRAQAKAEQIFPGYPDAQDRFVSTVQRRLNQTVSQQTRQYEVDTHVVQSALAGDNPPISEQELMSRSPQLASAWNSVKVNQPMAAMSIERMFDANARGRAVSNGSQFKDYLDRALAPGNNPDRLTNPAQVWPYVGQGDNAPLTNTGANALTQLMQIRGTPQGEAAATQIKAFTDQMHAQLTYTNRATGLVDPKGEAQFGKFMSTALPTIVKAAKEGNLPALLNPQSTDYLGKLTPQFMRSPTQVMTDRMNDVQNVARQPAYTPQTLNHALDGLDNDQQRQEALKDAVAKGRIPRPIAEQIAAQRGYIQRPYTPPVPMAR